MSRTVEVIALPRDNQLVISTGEKRNVVYVMRGAVGVAVATSTEEIDFLIGVLNQAKEKFQ